MEGFRKISEKMILIWFRYDSLLWFVCGLVLHLWFWYGFSHDFDIGHNCDLIWFDVGQTCDLCCGCFVFWKGVFTTYQNHLRITSTLPQNHPKDPWEIDQQPAAGGCWCFLFHRRPVRNAENLFPKHIGTISNSDPKPYLNHNPTMSKTNSYRNHNLKFKSISYHKIISKHIKTFQSRELVLSRAQEIIPYLVSFASNYGEWDPSGSKPKAAVPQQCHASAIVLKWVVDKPPSTGLCKEVFLAQRRLLILLSCKDDHPRCIRMVFYNLRYQELYS